MEAYINKENLAYFFLHFSHESIIVPMVIIGYIWANRDTFSHVICLVLSSMILSASLKYTFKIPLSPHLGIDGFAFPSGHMMSSFALYGYLTIFYKNILLRTTLISILFGIGTSLVYFRYHTYIDIIGGIIFGLIIIIAYIKIIKLGRIKVLYILLSIMSVSMLYIKTAYELNANIWMAYYALLGFTMADFSFRNEFSQLNYWQKLIITITCFVMIFSIKYIYSLSYMTNMPLALTQSKWLLIGSCIPILILLGDKYTRIP